MLIDLTQQLDKTQRLLRQLLAAKSGTRSEQLNDDQLRLFAQQLGTELPATVEPACSSDPSDDPPAMGGNRAEESKPRGRRQLPSHLKRDRIVHDLPAEEKHCAACDEDLRRIGEEVSERYE